MKTYKPILTKNSPSFAREFWKGLGYAVLAGAAIALSLVLIGMVVVYSQNSGW